MFHVVCCLYVFFVEVFALFVRFCCLVFCFCGQYVRRVRVLFIVASGWLCLFDVCCLHVLVSAGLACVCVFSFDCRFSFLIFAMCLFVVCMFPLVV